MLWDVVLQKVSILRIEWILPNYHQYSSYMVFISLTMCITVFPVFARILTELNLITDTVGTIVLAAAITNDLTLPILLALVVTLVSASNAVNTVYILLLTVA